MRQYRIGTWGLSVMALAWLGMAGEAWGQDSLSSLTPGAVPVAAPLPSPRSFGTATATAYVIGASEFDPINNAFWSYESHRKYSDVAMDAWVRLPTGAMVTSVELEGCDTDNTARVSFSLWRKEAPGGFEVLITAGGTGDPETPGCGFFLIHPLPQFSPLIIDNENHTYFVRVIAPSAATTVAAVRIFYILQVSPAPAIATFGDVPVGHPQRQYIEALVASGITAGCGGGNYCPDAPLTRGQMAVFLSKGLGLHFAP